jgi:hypothetical protein
MANHTIEREILILGCPMIEVLEWIGTFLTNMHVTTLTDAQCIICDGEYAGAITKVILTQYADAGFLGVSLNCPPFPWRQNVEFARIAFAALKRETRCDPGDPGLHSLSPFEWWRIDSAGEAIIDWNPD